MFLSAFSVVRRIPKFFQPKTIYLIDDCHDIVDRFYCQNIVDSHPNWM